MTDATSSHMPARGRRIFLHGQEGNGWSIDADRAHVDAFLRSEGYRITTSPILADAVHSVWWTKLLARRSFWIRRKRRILATATNEVRPDDPGFLALRDRVSLWVAPSQRQLAVFREAGVPVEYQPFRVDDAVFRGLGLAREAIAARLGLPPGICSGRFLIGSFQRDTMGKDLVSPKWQKGPEMLVEILSTLPRKKDWLLLLAGPRRHYVLAECKRRGIPYAFVGREPAPGEDDMGTNTLSQERMALLYNLTDCYVVSSSSEGGPKAVPEALLCGTPIISTDVGLAPDFVPRERIYRNADEARAMILMMMDGGGRDAEDPLLAAAYRKTREAYTEEAFRDRWRDAYRSLFEGA